jgi:hypothetical protein
MTGQPRELLNYRKQLLFGIKVESEHHLGAKMAAKIARDHLREDKNYYTKLKKAHL